MMDTPQFAVSRDDSSAKSNPNIWTVRASGTIQSDEVGRYRDKEGFIGGNRKEIFVGNSPLPPHVQRSVNQKCEYAPLI